MSLDQVVRKIGEIYSSYPLFFIVASGLCLIAFFLSKFFSPKGKGKNPFAKDLRRSPEPFQHDAKVRDSIIKQRFKASKVPDNLDVIIVGSGIGGLTAGVLLTRAGKKVLVLEQHDQAGGCCHTFVEKGFEFDTGIHYIGDMQDNSDIRVLLDQLTYGQLRWAKLDDAFDTVVIGKPATSEKYSMASGKSRYIQNLINLFPNEKEAILTYMDIVEDAASSFFGIVLLKILPRFLVNFLVGTGLHRLLLKAYRKGYTVKTLQETLDKLTDNKKLKLVLSYSCFDYGILPEEVPIMLHSGLTAHYMDGAYYPKAGSSEIAFYMVQAIQEGGGDVFVQAPVSEILCSEKGRVVGVQVGKGGVEIHAKHIISDAGVLNTFKILLPEKIAKKSCFYPLIEKVGPSYSFITVFCGIEGSSSELKLPSSNYWLYQGVDINKLISEFYKLKAEDVETADIPFAFISFPSAKDPEWENKYPGKSSLLAITMAKWEWFKDWKSEKLRHRGDNYEALKDAIGKQLWQHCVDIFPQLDGKKVYMEVGTPVTNQHYLASPNGEMYGLNHGKNRFTAEVASKLRQDTDIPGLYLTGQDTITCGFVPGVFSGLLCAGHILKRNLHSDLMTLKKDVVKAASEGKRQLFKKEE